MKLQDDESRTVDLKLERENKSKPGATSCPFLSAFNSSKTMVQRIEDFSTLVETSLTLKELQYEFLVNDSSYLIISLDSKRKQKW